MTLLTKLFVIATVTLSTTYAQSSSAAAPAPSASAGPTPTFKETYPADGSVPTPKAEWMALIANANITNAPIVKSSGTNGPQQSGSSDPYCDWTFTGCHGPTDIWTCPKGQWGITYDDGPTEFSPKLYDFLDQRNQKATFFLIGGQVIKFPQHTKRAFDAGHEMAIHTWSHSYLTTLTNEQIVGELKWTELAIKEVTGYSPRFYRPPYGDIDDRVRSIATALGFTAVIWDHDTDDWMVAESQGFQASWIDGNATEWASQNATIGGGISLEHDLYQQTVDAAIRILPGLQDAYKVTTVGACTNQPSYKETNATAVASAVSSAVPSASATISNAAGASSSAVAADNVTQGSAASSSVLALGAGATTTILAFAAALSLVI